MSAKICPECKFANKSFSQKCSQCGYSFPALTGAIPDRKHEKVKWIRPEQLVECPHCKNETLVLSSTKTDTLLTSLMTKTPMPSSTFPKFKCNTCGRDFLYYGPFKVECQDCGSNVSLSWKAWNDVASCSACDQRYRLSILPRKGVATNVLCKTCCPCLW